MIVKLTRMNADIKLHTTIITHLPGLTVSYHEALLHRILIVSFE